MVGAKSKRGDSEDFNAATGTITITTKASAVNTLLVEEILHGMQRRADPKTKGWFTDYVKGTTWLGCKVPVTRSVVKEVLKNTKAVRKPSTPQLLDAAVELLQHEACDVKLSGMLLLSEHVPLEELATATTLQRLEDDVLLQHCVDDWSSADWFAMKVLRKIVVSGDHELALRVLDYTQVQDTTHHHNYLYVRRCGVVSFLNFEKHRDALPFDFARQLVNACEHSLLTSPTERFTQTGIAWVLRYVLLLEKEERDIAVEMIVQHGSLWTMEAKKSLTEKLGKSDPTRKQILELE